MRLESLAAVAALSMPLLAGVASVASLNYGIHHNRRTSSCIEKIDGIASFTRVRTDYYIEVERISPCGNITYVDMDKDGLVDMIYEYPFYIQSIDAWALATKRYSRDSQSHQAIFLQADKDFRKQLLRFQLFPASLQRTATASLPESISSYSR